jgi:glycosyltransferase involved in cell wall biosynthesis
MRFLFFKAHLGWPRTYGHDVHSFEMMRALADLGHEVALASESRPSREAIAGLTLTDAWVLEGRDDDPPVSFTYWQERYRSYWGTAPARVRALRRIANAWRPDAVVVVGLETLAYLAAPDGPLRVWYAADEWVWHYLSQIRTDRAHALDHLKAAALKGAYERAYGSAMDCVWVVSDADRRAMRWVSGCRHVDVIPNGVDAERFQPVEASLLTHSAVFWGRLGFGPNLQALRWFHRTVWPQVRAEVPHATFSILGADPPDEVRAWDGRDGIRVVANPADLRPEISRHAIAVMPFVSGAGIKNKLLEAAAMERALVVSSRTLSGLRSRPPALVADEPVAFARAMTELWNDPGRAQSMGREARAWAIATHGWRQAAEQAVASMRS